MNSDRITRRGMVQAALAASAASPLAAQTPASAIEAERPAAEKATTANAQALRKLKLPQLTEPAFAFRAF